MRQHSRAKRQSLGGRRPERSLRRYSTDFKAGSMTFEVATPGVNADRPMRKKVLIVEDNDLNMKLFNDLLVAHGYGTLQTKDGVEALALARQHHPDLILMDIQLPEISGLQVTQWIKK